MAEAMASNNVHHGTQRVLAKIEKLVENRNFYEAHQLYKSLHFRYLAQKKYVLLLSLLHDGALLLLEHDQQNSGVDIGCLFIDVLVKSNTKPNNDNLLQIGRIFGMIAQGVPGRDTFLAAALRWAGKNPQLHQCIADVYWREKNYSAARKHFMRSYDGSNFGAMLIELHKKSGYKSEVDLFIAQVVLQCLCLKNKKMAEVTFQSYTSHHPSITKGPPYLFPLLNFLWFLLEILDDGRFTQYAVLCQEYKLSLNRDPTYVHYLDRIGQLFFNIAPPPPANRSSTIFGDLFQSIVQTFGDYSDDEEPDDRYPASSSTSVSAAPQIMETELD